MQNTNFFSKREEAGNIFPLGTLKGFSARSNTWLGPQHPLNDLEREREQTIKSEAT